MLAPECLRAEAQHFLEWCRFNLRHLGESLAQEDKEQFLAGKLPQTLIAAVEAAWVAKLKTSLMAQDYLTAIKGALPVKSDYEAFMKASYGRPSAVQQHILDVVAKEQNRKQDDNCERFLATCGPKRLEMYLRIWQSQSRALSKLTNETWGYKEKVGGGASVGGIEIDIERMMLSEAEATGSAMQVPGLLPFIKSLWEKEETVLVKTNSSKVDPTATDWGPGYERRVIPNPAMSEKRLNRFLIKLGRALVATAKRRALPDWTHMDQTNRFIVHGWCENIIVDDEPWPMLCLLSTPALAKFLSLCKPPRWKEHQDPRTLERRITRLGLLRISTARIKHVKKTANGIELS